jgi:DNA-binding NarL/FixJ family response regulator
MDAAAVPPLPVTVVIADDHRLFAEALETIVSGDPRFRVLGHARDGEEAVALVERVKPDVVLMDISMPVMDGLEATRRIVASTPNAAVLMLTGSNARLDVDQARKAGAAGYVTKDRIAAELIEAILNAVGR